MPVYNAESTLQKAAESILRQSVTDLELLLMEDGSTDGSLALCRQLEKSDLRVRVYSQENKGICAARNAGLSRAEGRYIAFCDDDDEWLPGALHTLLSLTQSQNADLVRGGYKLQREKEDGTFAMMPHPPGHPCKLSQGYHEFLQNSGPQFVWNALYRRAALKGITFDENCRYGLEDFLFNAQIYARIQSGVYTPEPVYLHNERKKSTSQRYTEQALAGRVAVFPQWLAAEYAAADYWRQPPVCWSSRCAFIVAFLMHQLRESAADPETHRKSWAALRRAMAEFPAPEIKGLPLKQKAALLLYRLHWQGIYDFLPNHEVK